MPTDVCYQGKSSGNTRAYVILSKSQLVLFIFFLLMITANYSVTFMSLNIY